MKTLILGGGAVAEKYHIPAAVDLLGADNVYLAEPDPGRRAHLLAKFRLKHAVVDYHDFLEVADCAIVLTPPHLHPENVIECFEAGLPVLCEKPLASTVRECDSILDAARRTSQILGVCHDRRFFPNRASIRERLQAEEFGSKITIDVAEGGPANWPTLTGYTFRKELVPGGVLLNNGIHSLDFLLWCFGQPMDLVYSDDSIGGLESNAEVTLHFANNCQGRLRITRTCSLANTIRITGDDTSVTLLVHEQNRISGSTNAKKEFIATVNGRTVTDRGAVAVAQLADFEEAVQDARPPRCDGEAGKSVVEVIENCYSLKRSRPLPAQAPVPGARW